MSDPTLQEIDDELRRERTAEWFRRYGAAIASVIMTVIVLVGGYQGWRHWQESTYQKQADAFHEAIGKLSSNKEEALTALQQIAASNTSGYSSLADLERAKALASDDKKAEALTAYLAIADNKAHDAAIRELSLLVAAYMASEQHTSDTVSERITAAVANKESIFPGLFKEWLALWHWEKKETEKAAALLREVSEDAASPQGLQYRTERMLHVITSQTEVK